MQPRGVGSDNAVVRREPAREVALRSGQDLAVTVDDQQHLLGHADYSIGGLGFCAMPCGPGACMRVSSV